MSQSYRKEMCLPGCGVCKGESARAAASRELQEELKIHIPCHQLNPALSYEATLEYCQSRIDVFEAVLREVPRFCVEHREIIEAAFYDESSLGRLELDPISARYVRSLGSAATQVGKSDGELTRC